VLTGVSVSVHLLPEWSALKESAKPRQTPFQSNRIVENIEALTELREGSSRTTSHGSYHPLNGKKAPAGNAKVHYKPMSQGSDKIDNRIHTQGGGTQPEVMAMLDRMVRTTSNNFSRFVN
jgi:hypothetical protein